MKRRDFLQTAAALGGVGAATGCASLSAIDPGPTLDPARMKNHIARLDQAVQGIDRHMVLPRPLDPERDRAARDVLASLVEVGAFIDLSPEDQAHPGMQARMNAALPRIDRALRDSLNRVSQMTPTERADLQRTLRENPDALDDVGAFVDRHAAFADMPLTQRARWRQLLKRLGPKLRQSLDMTLDTYCRKTEALMARSGDTAELERTMIGHMGREAYAERARRAEAAARGWAALGVTASTTSGTTTAADDERPPTRHSYEPFSASATTLGVGALTTLVGWILIGIGGSAGGLGLVLGVTVGPILMGIALLWLLVDVIIYAARD